MKLLSIELEDVCQHASLRATFHHGLNGLLGDNGSGKTNLVKAVLYALTNDFDNAGAKEENIRQLAPPGAKGRVVLRFEHGGVDYRVARTIADASATLDADDVRIANGATQVNKVILEKLGVPVDVLRRHAFVSQKTISQFLSETPTVRAASYARIFGTEGIAGLHTLADRALKADAAPPRDPRLDEGEADLRRLQGQERAFNHRLFQLRKATPRPADVEAARLRLERAAKAEGARLCIPERRGRVGELAGELDMARATLERYDADRAAAAAAGSVVAARQLWRAYDLATQEARKRAVRLDTLSKQLAAMADPGPTPDPEGFERRMYEGRVAEAEAEEIRLGRETRQVSQLVEGHDLATCPVCGAEGRDLSGHLASLRAQLAEQRDRVTAARNDLAYYNERGEKWRVAHRDYRKLADEADTLTAQVGQDVASPPERPTVPRPDDGPTPQPPPADHVYAAARKDVDRLVAGLAFAEAKLAAAIAEAEADPGDTSGDAATVARHDECARNLAETQQEIEHVRRTMAQLRPRLESLRAAEADAAPLRAWCATLGAVKAAFHPTALPRAVAEQNQALMVDRINEVLASFGVDWRVAVAPELAFTAVFDDGRVQADRRLSPGQLTTLALATRVAIHTLFASDLGFLALDEPTDGLSQRNISHVAAAIDHLRGVAEAGSLQCVVITHEPQLGALMDHVIDLDRAP